MGGIVPKNQDNGILEFGAGGTSTRLVFILLMGSIIIVGVRCILPKHSLVLCRAISLRVSAV